ncbi:MAG: sulfotransferase [Pseudonocardia sediminis]
MTPRLPGFLLLGAPKCGTSALHNALSTHPGLFLSTPKEPKFFLTDGPPPTSGGGPGDVPTWGEHVWRREDYEALFDGAAPDALCGESTVFYLYDRDAQRRIRDLLPAARLVAVLRDPVERAHSNWAHLRGAGLEPEEDFVAALELEKQRIADGWAHFWHYAAQGRYGEQLEHLFSLFPREQVLLLRYRELRDAPAATADRVCAFLGVETGVVTGVPRHNVRPDVSGRTSGPTPSERDAALPYVVDDVARVEALTSWDLDDWRH